MISTLNRNDECKKEELPILSSKTSDLYFKSVKQKEPFEFKNFHKPAIKQIQNVSIIKNVENKFLKKHEKYIKNNNSSSSKGNYTSTFRNFETLYNEKSSNMINLNSNINTDSNTINDKIADYYNGFSHEFNSEIKKQPKLNNLRSMILSTDSSIGKSIKPIQGPKLVEKIESQTIKNFNPISKSQGKKLYKKSFDYIKNLNIPEEKNIILANLLKSNSNENEIKQQQEKIIINNNKNSFNLNFNINNIQNSIRNISEIPQINSFRNSNKNINNNNNNISNLNLNSNSKSKELNINSNKNFQNASSKKNLENNFRKTSFQVFSENLKLNRDKKNNLFYRTSNDFSKNSLENNRIKIERIDNINKSERKKTDILQQKPNLKLFINENNNNDNNNNKKSSKLIPKLTFNLNNFPINNNNVDNINHNNNIVSNNKAQNNNFNNTLNNEIFNFKSNFTNRSRCDRNKVKEEKDIYAETLYKNFMSHTKGSEEDISSKIREKSENNGTLTIFQSFDSDTNSNANNEDYYNQEIKKPEFYKSSRLISFSPPVANNKQSIFGFSSNFMDNSDAWYNKINNANNIENEKNNINPKNTKSSLFDSYFIKDNNMTNYLPKNNQFLALNKSNSFKYFSNFNNQNSIKTDNINSSSNNCHNQYNNLNNYKNNHSENLETEEESSEEARQNSERIKNKFTKMNDIDIKFCRSDNNFYKDEYTFTYSKSKLNSKGISKETLNHYKNNKHNVINEENPTEFETDLKKNTKEFCKNKILKFYEIKPHTFNKLAEFNRKKIKNFLVEESKNLELLEKIEKKKNSKVSENATNKFMEFVFNKEERENESIIKEAASENEEIKEEQEYEQSEGENEPVNNKKSIKGISDNYSKSPNKNSLNFKRNMMRKDTFIFNKPKKCFTDGRTQNFSDIFERKSCLKFGTMKVDPDALKKCLVAIEDQNNFKIKNKMEEIYEKVERDGEIEVPEMPYLKQAKMRMEKIIVKDFKVPEKKMLKVIQ